MSVPQPRTVRSGGELRVLRAAVFAAVCVVLAAAGHTLASCTAVPLWTLGAGFLGSLLVVAPLAGRARSLPGIAALLAVGQTVLHTLFGLGQHGAAVWSAGASGAMSMGPMGPMGTSAAQSLGTLKSAEVTGTSAGSMNGMSDALLVERAARLVCGGTTPITPGHAYRMLSDARLLDDPGGNLGVTSGALHHAGGATGAPAALLASLLPSLPMLLAHALAAVAVGWVLRRGDLAVLRLIELSAHEVAEGTLVRALRAACAMVRALYAGLRPEPEPGPRERRTSRDDVPAPRTLALQHTVIRRGPPSALAVAA
ncbi:hypothetical protein [Streptomyces sp. V3I7]|uniref:hypothetical protein n=1 Tax=Streptomyces sp. V3I7 TaxID=3042278 RepID=UPI0027D8F4DF|nr:hypothetical protein [Streptomyces sp. V3I7]